MAARVVCLAFALLAVDAHAAGVASETISTEVERILAAPEFDTRRTTHEFRYRGDPWWIADDDGATQTDARRPGPIAFLDFVITVLARLSETLLWAVALAGVVLGVIYRKRWLPLLASTPQRRQPRMVTIVGGVEPEPAALPDDIAGTARRLSRDGDPRAGLSLLYRGALGEFVARHGLRIPDSATESDCLARVARVAGSAQSAFFAELTATWMALAYARRIPADADVEHLCRAWDTHFGSTP